MKKRILFYLFVLVLTSSAQGLDMASALKGLAAEDYAVRKETRLELKQAFAEATSPDAADGQQAALESAIISSLGVELPLSETLYLIRLLEWFGTSRAVESLEVLLESPDPHVRDSARRALTAIPGEKASRCLVAAMGKALPDEIDGFIDAFVSRDETWTTDLIIPYLKSDNPELKIRAALALGKLGDEEAVRAMWKARKKCSPEVRQVIEISLLDMELMPRHLKTLARKSASGTLRHAAFIQLVEVDPQKAKKTLQEALVDPGFPGRLRIVHTALTDGPENLQDLVVDVLPEVEPRLQRTIVLGIGEAELSRFEPQLLTLLESASGDLRERLIQVIAQVGGDASYPALYAEFVESPKDRDLAYAIGRLRAPMADALALDIVENGTDPEKRAIAMSILKLRNSPGATELLNSIVATSEDPDMRVGAAKCLEVIGDPESIRILIDLVIQNTHPLKKLQLSLKRLSVNFNDGDYLWEHAYQSALEAAPSDEARERVITILDGSGGAPALTYLQEIILDTDSELRGTALRTLSRWPHFAAGEFWLEMIDSGSATEAEVELAYKSLLLLLGNSRVKGPETDKLDMAVRVIEQAPSAEYKHAVLDCYSGNNLHWRYKQNLKSKFSPLLADPEIADHVQQLLDKHS